MSAKATRWDGFLAAAMQSLLIKHGDSDLTDLLRRAKKIADAMMAVKFDDGRDDDDEGGR